MRLPLALMLIALLGGCRTPLLPETGGNPDGGALQPDAGSCTLEAVPLDWLRGDDLNLCPSDLVRVTFQITLDACRPVRPALITFDSANNRYTVTAQACSMPTCQPPPTTVQRTVFLSETARPQPGMLEVRDGAPGSNVSTILPIQKPDASGLCGTVNGSGCQSDTQCTPTDPSTRCWYDGSTCERICFDDTDCLAAAPHCTLGFCS